jgi:tripartite-type tricarboxylate transporter receptor subunit TctC
MERAFSAVSHTTEQVMTQQQSPAVSSSHRQRRRITAAFLLAGAIAALPLTTLPSAAQAQAWPQKPLRIVVPFAAGGNTDGIARLTAERLTGVLGQQVIVENRAGANGAIAAEYVARAAPDGYTFLMAAMPLVAVLPAVARQNYDPVKDFVAISNIGSNPFVLGVHKSVPAKDVREFVAWVKSNPGKTNYASGGSGSVSHLSAALFVKRAGLDMVHVSYKGGAPAVADLLGGQVQMYFGNLSELAPHAAGGNIRIIGVSSEKRARQLPEVPTIAESGFPGFRTLTWNGLMAPAGTPQVVVTRVAAEVKKIAADPAFAARMDALGVDTIGSTPAEFADTVRADIALWADAVKAANLKIE